MVEKVRPALVLSGGCVEEDRDLITVVPHTTTLRASRFEIAVPLPFLRPGAFLAQNPATVPSPPSLKLLGGVRAEDLAATTSLLPSADEATALQKLLGAPVSIQVAPESLDR